MTEARDYRQELETALRQRIAEIEGCVVQLRDGAPVYDSSIVAGREPSKTQDEELVRALYVVHLVHDLGYSPATITIERRIRARVGRGQRDMYADIVISRNSSGPATPYCLIELKTADSYHAEKDDSWESQLFGLVGFIDPRPSCLVYGTYRPEWKGRSAFELELADSHAWSAHAEWLRARQPIQSDTIPSNYGMPRKAPYVNGSTTKDLRREIGASELTTLQRSLHNVLWGGGGETDTEVFNLLTRLIFAKAYDETLTAPGDEYRFQLLDGESVESALERITELYREAMKQRLGYSDAIADAAQVRAPGTSTDAHIRFAIERLERYHFTDLANSPSQPDLLGTFFEYIMRAGFKQSKGQFFTHANIAEFVVQAMDLGEWAVENAKLGNDPPRILDPAAGAGTFLIRAMNSIRAELEAYNAANPNGLSPASRSVVSKVTGQDRRNDWASDSCFGMEINSDLGLAAQVNMFVHGDGSSSMSAGQQNGDGLRPLSHYGRREVAKVETVAPYPQSVAESFDAIVSNPPFAVNFTDEQHEAHKASFTIANQTRNSEEIFLERWFQFLKSGGRLGVVVPNSLLDGRSNVPGRDFLIKHFWIKAIISLPSDAFYPHTMTKTSLLFAQKKTHAELMESYARDTIANLHANETITFGRAAYMGYRRTAKSETAIERNDLARILPLLKQRNIWTDAIDAESDAAIKTIPTQNLRTEPNVRLDADYALSQSTIQSPVPISQEFTVGEGRRVDAEPEGAYRYCEIGDVQGNGMVYARTIDPALPAADPELHKQEERIRRKVQQRKAMTLNQWCVLVPKTRPYLGKFAIVSGNESVYYTTDFFVLEPGNALTRRCDGSVQDTACLLFLLLKGPLNTLLTSLSRWGKSYPTLHPDDLGRAIIDSNEIEALLTDDWIDRAQRTRRVVGRVAEELTSLQQLIP